MLDDAVAPAAPTALAEAEAEAAPPEGAPAAQEAPAAREAPPAEASPAAARFRSCRWHEQKDGNAEYCSHPDVLPYAGRNGFKAEAWCPECAFHKVRRSTRRRDADLDY